MNKIMIAIIAAAVLTGCTRYEDRKDTDNAWIYRGMDCYTKIVEIEGHKYIIMDGNIHSGDIIHAASCPCLNK